MAYVFRTLPSPVGPLRLVAGPQGLAAVLWPDDWAARTARVPHVAAAREQADCPLLLEAERQLRAYFAGTRRHFALPYEPVGQPFSRRVWLALDAIPYGATRSYGELAAELGVPGAARAVGAANGRNPLSIVVPCHRVVGAGGRLTGFAGGLAAKAALLALEARHAPAAGLPLWGGAGAFGSKRARPMPSTSGSLPVAETGAPQTTGREAP